MHLFCYPRVEFRNDLVPPRIAKINVRSIESQDRTLGSQPGRIFYRGHSS